MKTLALFGMILALALPLVAARPAAADEPGIVAWATGDTDPFVANWEDQGNSDYTKFGPNNAVHSIFAGVQYVFTDDGQLTLGQLNGLDFQRIWVPLHAIDVSDGKGYYVVHLRLAIGMSLDGAVYRFSDQPDQGLARLTLILVDKAGNATTTYIEQSLKFADEQPGPSPQPKSGGGN